MYLIPFYQSNNAFFVFSLRKNFLYVILKKEYKFTKEVFYYEQNSCNYRLRPWR